MIAKVKFSRYNNRYGITFLAPSTGEKYSYYTTSRKALELLLRKFEPQKVTLETKDKNLEIFLKSLNLPVEIEE